MTRTPNQQAVIQAIRGAEGISAGEIIDASGVKRKTVEHIRRNLHERGPVEKEGEGRWARYTDVGLNSLNSAGDVSLDPIPETPYNYSIKGNSGIDSPGAPIKWPLNPFELPMEERYPGWMRKVQRRARHLRADEQLKRYNGAS